jgi:hypothetical protein
MWMIVEVILIGLIILNISMDIITTRLQKKYKDELSRSNKIIIDAMKNYIDSAKVILEKSKEELNNNEGNNETINIIKCFGNNNQLPKIDPKG